MVNIRQTILNAKDIRTELVVIPEWGDVKVEVRGFTLQERLDFYGRVSDGDTINREHFLPELAISTCFDPDTGQKVFEPADRDMLKTKSAAALERITSVAMTLSGLAEADVVEAEKDLDETPTDDS